MGEELRIFQPQLVGAQQELGKINHTGTFTGFFVGLVNPQHDLGIGVRGGRLNMGRAQALVLLSVDIPLGLPGRPAPLVQVQLPTNAFHQAPLVIGVEYLEILR